MRPSPRKRKRNKRRWKTSRSKPLDLSKADDFVNRGKSETLRKRGLTLAEGPASSRLFFCCIYDRVGVFAQAMPCTSTLPHPVLRVAREARCLTVPALDCCLKLNTMIPTEVESSGKLHPTWCLFFHLEREECFSPLLSCLFLSFSSKFGAVTGQSQKVLVSGGLTLSQPT